LLIRTPYEEHQSPHGVSTACWEATPTVSLYPVQPAMPCKPTDGNQSSTLSLHDALPISRTSAGSFLRVWPATVACCRGCVGGGKPVKLRSAVQADAFLHCVSMACGEATATVALYPVQRAMPCEPSAGKQTAEFSASQPVK